MLFTSKRWKLLMGMVSMVIAFATHGMTLVTQGDTLFAGGEVGDDYIQFSNALENKNINRVVFVNSPGGDLWTGMRIGRMIADHNLNTVVAGVCSSACSIMFMGGRLRTFSDAFPASMTFVGIHGPSNKYTKIVDSSQAAQMFAFYKRQMGEHFNADFMNQSLYDMEDSGALTRVFDAFRFPKLASYHCKSEQSLRKDCNEFKNEDAYTLGVVTSVDLTPLELPSNFKVVQRVQGTVLSIPIDYNGAVYQQLGVRSCKSDKCKQVFGAYPTYRQHKALAIPLDSNGFSTSNGSDSASKAQYSVLYSCNHVKDIPTRLCEVYLVDDYDVHGQLYEQAQKTHEDALQKLQPPTDKYYADEQYGGMFTDAKAMRTQKLHDITPQKIDGIQTIGTQALASWLKSNEPPVVVDVLAGADEAIPTAVTLFAGGLAFDDPVADAAYKARFQGLLKLLSPDLARPVVFYCVSRDCWLSVNAAMRARDLGYTHVNWYRGGMSSWKAAGLPTGRVMVRAVVQ